MPENPSSATYIPGNCNIGPAEIRRRYRIGYIGLSLMILFILGAEYFEIPHPWKLVLFVPAVIALSGFLQASQKFCFFYGIRGLASMTGRQKFVKVKAGHNLLRDRSMALRLISRVILGSSVITLVYYYLS